MDILLAVDPALDVPLHRQVYEAIRSSILTGRLRPGDRMPATRALAGDLSLSRTTVTVAYDQLQAEGYLLGRHGSGTYVAPNLPESALQASSTDADRDPAASKPAGGTIPPWPAPHSVSSGGHSMPEERRSRELPLSAWGRRISAPAYRALVRPATRIEFPYDFLPHRVAEDSFPWDDWRAAIERAMAAGRAGMLFYPPSAGHPDLQEAIAAHVARYRAVVCDPEQVVIVSGSQQGLNLLAHLLLDPNERVAVEDPGYPTARLALEANGLAVSRVPVDREGLIVERLIEYGPHRLVHVTPSHQDPTGATMSLSRRLALLELAERTGAAGGSAGSFGGCLIYEDDYDSEFRYEGRPVESLQGLDRNGLVVYAGTFSKSILPGLRIGFLVLPRHLVAPFVTAKSLWDSGTPMLEQAGLAEFLRAGDFERHIRRMRRLYALRRDALISALGEAFGDRVTIGERHGGLNVLVSLDAAMSETRVVEVAAEAGIGLRAASPYYAHPPEVPTFLMGFGAVPEGRIREGVQQLSLALL
ncbi:MAG: PLP-dependent aminotransferase family protein [Chloroflexota bacterium]|nr:PLP-dependent aminotransferase family protein [Chloroflexota bacterium]